MKPRLFLGLALVVIGLFGESLWESVKNINWPEPETPVNTVVEPSMELQTLVQPIVDEDISPEDASLMSAFFEELASVVANDSEFIQTTGQFRTFNVTAGGLNFNKQLKNKYENLGESIDAAIMEAIGKENASMDDEKRSDLTEVLMAVAWGVKQ
jgi:hypothetical protein